MAFSYNPNDLSLRGGFNKDRMRLTLGDTISEHPLLQDEEYDFFIEDSSSLEVAISKAAEAIAFKFARESSYAVGALRYELDRRADRFKEIAREWKSRAGSSTPAGPTAIPSSPSYFGHDIHSGQDSDDLYGIHIRGHGLRRF